MSGTKTSSHIEYRGFWIRNNRINRRKVDRFYQSYLRITGISLTKKINILQGLCFMGDNTAVMPSLYCELTNTIFTNHGQLVSYFKTGLANELTNLFSEQIGCIKGTKQERILAAKKLFRLLAFTYESWSELPEFESFKISTANKALSLAQQGMTEAFLVFSMIHPNLCTTQIQPHVNQDPLIYSDENWDRVVGDPVYSIDVLSHVYFLSGFNYLWKEELNVSQKHSSEWPLDIPENVKIIYKRKNPEPQRLYEEDEWGPVVNLVTPDSASEWDELEKLINQEVREVKECDHISPFWRAMYTEQKQMDSVMTSSDRIADSSWTRENLMSHLRGRGVPLDTLRSNDFDDLLRIHYDLDSWEHA